MRKDVQRTVMTKRIVVITSEARRSVILNISEKSIKRGRTVAGDGGASGAFVLSLSSGVDAESGELSSEAEVSVLV